MSPSYFSNNFRIQPIQDLVDWQVGDRMEYKLDMTFLSGSSVRSVVSEELVDGNQSIWVENIIDLIVKKQKVEQLIRRYDAAVLKMIVNGEEQDIPDPGEMDIVEQDYVKVTVPAGTFKSVWMKVNTKEIEGVEVWINPKETAMDGMLKMITPSQFGNMTMKLKSFYKVQRRANK